MADHTPTGPLEMGAKMDYSEHDKTYSLFINLAKITAVVCTALLIAMAFGFFTSAGFVSAIITFLVLTAVGIYALR